MAMDVNTLFFSKMVIIGLPFGAYACLCHPLPCGCGSECSGISKPPPFGFADLLRALQGQSLPSGGWTPVEIL